MQESSDNCGDKDEGDNISYGDLYDDTFIDNDLEYEDDDIPPVFKQDQVLIDDYNTIGGGASPDDDAKVIDDSKLIAHDTNHDEYDDDNPPVCKDQVLIRSTLSHNQDGTSPDGATKVIDLSKEVTHDEHTLVHENRISFLSHFMKSCILNALRIIARKATIQAPTIVLISVPIFSISVFAAGFFTNFTLKTDFSKVFAPDNSKAAIYRDWITHSEIQPNKYAINTILHRNGENVLTKDAVGVLFEAYEGVQATEKYTRACGPNFDILQEVTIDSCDFNGIINVFNNTLDSFNEVIDNDEMILHVLASTDMLKEQLIIDEFFGQPAFENERIVSAQALKMKIQIPTHLVDGVKYKEGVQSVPHLYYDEEFEKEAVRWLVDLKELLEKNESEYSLEVNSADSWLAEGNRTVADDLYLVVIVFVLIGAITSIYFFARDRVESSMLMGLGAVACIACSAFTAFGVLFLCGFGTTPLTLTIIFVLFGVGLDDTFVIVGAYKRTDNNLTIEERIDSAMKDCGASIFLTTITTSTAFILGTTSKIPGLRDYFVYASLSILVDFLYQITFFVALLYKDEKRKLDNRKDCIVCMRNPPRNRFREERIHNRDHAEASSLISNALLKYCNLLHASKVARILVIVGFVTFSISASVYVGKLKVSFSTDDMLPDDSFVKEFMSAQENYDRGSERWVRSIFFRFQDFGNANVRTEMRNYINEIVSVEQVPYKPSTWFEDFDEWDSNMNWTSSHDNLSFVQKLDHFLENDEKEYESQLIRDKNGNIVASHVFLVIDYIGWNNAVEQMNFLKQLWAIDIEFYYRMYQLNFTDNFENIPEVFDPKYSPVFSYTEDDILWEFFELIPQELLFTTIISFSVICSLVVIFIPNFVAILSVLPTVAMIYIDILGLMKLNNLFINPITLIAIIMSLGLLVDFVLHIVMASFEDDNSRTVNIRGCMNSIGSSVFIGGLTTIISTSPLLFSTSSIFQNIFIIFFSFVILSLLHGLVFVPAILVFFDKTELEQHQSPNTTAQKSSMEFDC